MKIGKNFFENRREEKRTSKSSSWIQLFVKIILLVAVILLIKHLSFSGKKTGFLFEQLTPQENVEDSIHFQK